MKLVPRLEEQEMLEKFQPLHDFAVVRKWKPPERTEEGVIVLEDSKDYQSKRGTVVKVGDCSNLKARNIPIPAVKPGDEVLFSAFAGSEIPMPEGYLIMRLSEILTVIEDA
jgi:co-chaperonin GroES (HSP10)